MSPADDTDVVGAPRRTSLRCAAVRPAPCERAAALWSDVSAGSHSATTRGVAPDSAVDGLDARCLLLDHPQSLLAVVGTGNNLLDLGDSEGALDDCCGAEL